MEQNTKMNTRIRSQTNTTPEILRAELAASAASAVNTHTPAPTPRTDGPCQATDPATLRHQIMNCNVPKNEREWWSARTIEKLERELAEAKKERDAITADNTRLFEALKRAKWYQEGDNPATALVIIKDALAAYAKLKEETK